MSFPIPSSQVGHLWQGWIKSTGQPASAVASSFHKESWVSAGSSNTAVMTADSMRLGVGGVQAEPKLEAFSHQGEAGTAAKSQTVPGPLASARRLREEQSGGGALNLEVFREDSSAAQGCCQTRPC
ncbi:hypothetical protein HJG60_009902 [Phyllostomus discolor]|uniref:Uncharacterized protein n=1 Tax=Phyllostomus discolor TaxID=89673 RepID=A0A834BCL2_9CHIR|nr:hypothetical protein HJG60_009902 [Phyllostomus discolor]